MRSWVRFPSVGNARSRSSRITKDFQKVASAETDSGEKERVAWHQSRWRLVIASRVWPERVITQYYQQVLLTITFLRLCDIGSQRSFGT